MDTQTATLTGNGLSLTRTKAPGTKTWPTPPAPTLEYKMYSGLTHAQFYDPSCARTRNTVYPSTFRDGGGAPMSRRQDGSTDTLTGDLLRAAAVSGLVTGL